MYEIITPEYDIFNCQKITNNNVKNSKCIHNTLKLYCKECKVTSHSENNKKPKLSIKSKRTKNRKDICPHNRKKSFCKECGGSQICQHNRQKSHCKECGGSQICQHNRQKANCNECNILYYGQYYQQCIHNNYKYKCKICYKSKKSKKSIEICQHNNIKSECQECFADNVFV